MISGMLFSENHIGVHTTTCVSPGSCRAFYELVSQLVYLDYMWAILDVGYCNQGSHLFYVLAWPWQLWGTLGKYHIRIIS